MQYLFDQQQIISGTTALELEMPYALKGVKLDDGYPLQNNAVQFCTPEYRLNITSTSEENYLQLYTPNTPNVIAIEPMINLGTKDVFHDKDGWTIRTADGKPSAHYEHDICVQKGKADILSSFEPIEAAERANAELCSDYMLQNSVF